MREDWGPRCRVSCTYFRRRALGSSGLLGRYALVELASDIRCFGKFRVFHQKRFPPLRRTVPSPWNFASDALYMIPHLVASELSYTRSPHSVVTFGSAPLFSDTTHPPACKPEEARGICNNVDRAQSVFHHPAASYRDGHSVPVLSAASSAGTAAAPKAAGPARRHRSARPKALAPLL